MVIHLNISRRFGILFLVWVAALLNACGYRADSLENLQQTTSIATDPNTAPADGITPITVHVKIGDSLLADNRGAKVRLEAFPNTLVLTQPGQPDKNGVTSASITSTTPGTYAIRAYLVLLNTEYLLDDMVTIAFTMRPQSLQLSATPSFISVDTQPAATLYAELRDSGQLPIADTPVAFQSSVAEDLIQPSTAITDAQGRATASLLSTKPGARVISAMASGVSSTLALEIFPGACDSASSKISVNPNAILYGASQKTSDITVVAHDRYQNPVPNVQIALSSSQATDTLLAPLRTTDATGTASFKLTADTDANVTWHLLQATMQNITLNANLLVQPSIAAQYCSLDVHPNTQIADNANVITAVVSVRDNHNNPVPQVPVFFSASGMTTQLSDPTAVSDSNGQATCSYYSSIAQNENIVAQAQNIVFTSPISFTHGTESAELSYLTRTPASQPADGTDALQISAYLKDRFGNAVGNKTVSFSVSGAAGPFSSNTAVTNGSGLAQTNLVSSVAGVSQVYAATPNLSLNIQAKFTSNAGYCNAEPNYTINTISVANAPQNIVSSDLNKDGCLDLVVTENGNDTVSILLGDCHGNFNVTARYGVGAEPWGLVAVDFDQDGHTDLATATAGDGNVAVLLGLGDGTFQAPIVYSAVSPPGAPTHGGHSNDPFEMATADFNEDGYPDLAVAIGKYNKMVVFLGTGLGTLNPGQVFQTGTKPWGIVAADFNKDGHADIALPINNTGQFQNYVSLWAGKGNGAFQTQAAYASQGCLQGIAVGDFDGDSYYDMAVPNDCVQTISIFWGGDSNTNLGRGALAAAPTYVLTGEVPNWGYDMLSTFGGLRMYDFDQDGSLDVVVTDTRPTTTHTALFFGSPTGALTFANEAGTGNYGVAIDLADIHENGRKNVIVSTSNEAMTIFGLDVLAYNAPGRNLIFEKTIPLENLALDVKAVDLNQDGHIDFVFTADTNQGNVGILFGQGGGNFNDVVYFQADTQPTQLAIGDWNQDGNQDIAVTTLNGVDLLWGQGGGSFMPGTPLSPNLTFGGIVSADLNGDGFADLAATTYSNKQLAVFPGKSGGGFGSPRMYNVARAFSTGLAAADLNGDGYPDLVATQVTSEQFSLSVFFGTSSGIFQNPVYYQAGLGNPSVQITDLNQDGRLDVITGSMDNMLVTFFNKGQGALQSSTIYAANSSPWSIHVNDFNGDGIQDLVSPSGPSNNTTKLFMGRGDGTFKSPYGFSAGSSSVSAVSGDFDGDTYMDFAVTDVHDDSVHVYLYRSCNP